jgi:hypothetical protein
MTIKLLKSHLKRKDITACIICCILGVAIAVLPHIVVFIKHGTLEYLADGDDVLYLSITKAPYYGEWSLRDPFARYSDKIPTLYSWLQFVPLSRLVSLLGIPLILFPIVLRSIGGIMISISLYVLFRLIFSRSSKAVFFATLCTLICLFDGGLLGRPLVENFSNLMSILANKTLDNGNSFLPQHRIITPLNNIPIVFLLSGLFLPVTNRSWKTGLVGGILLGCCIHLYFFFWTSIFLALGLYGIILCFLGWKGIVSSTRTKKELSFLLIILLGGLIVGSPQILSNSSIYNDPNAKMILYRMSRGIKLFAEDPFRYNYIINFWTWLQLTIGGIAIIKFKHYSLVIIWLISFAGYVLLNLAAFTGLEFENFHWTTINKSFGEILILSSLVLIFQDKKIFKTVLKFLVISIVSTGVLLRSYEPVYAKEPIKLSNILEEIRPLYPFLARIDRNSVLAGPMEANVASLFTKGGQLYQFNQTSHSSVVSDTSVLERHALNSWLLGYSFQDYQDDDYLANHFSGGGNLYIKPEKWQAKSVNKIRLDIFKDILDEKRDRELLGKYSPIFLLQEVSKSPRNREDWEILSKSTKWVLWKKK